MGIDSPLGGPGVAVCEIAVRGIDNAFGAISVSPSSGSRDNPRVKLRSFES